MHLTKSEPLANKQNYVVLVKSIIVAQINNISLNIDSIKNRLAIFDKEKDNHRIEPLSYE